MDENIRSAKEQLQGVNVLDGSRRRQIPQLEDALCDLKALKNKLSLHDK